MEEADLKAQAFERVNDLEDEVGRLNEKVQELEVTGVNLFSLFLYQDVT